MYRVSISHLLRVSWLLCCLFLLTPSTTKADVLAEYLFWNEMGKQVGNAVSSYNDYKEQRQLWQDNIAAAKAELAACGGCASAKEKLAKWQGIENKFQDVAGSLALQGHMPRDVANILGIDVPLTAGRTAEQRQEACGIVRQPWADTLPQACAAAVDEYLGCIRSVQQARGFCQWSSAKLVGNQCYDKWKLYNLCGKGDMDAFEKEKELQAARKAGQVIPEYAQSIYGTSSSTVYYGQVPDDFSPDLPPRNVIAQRLEEVGQVRLLMNRVTTGKLREILFRWYHSQETDPFTKCFGLDRPTDEIGQRICEDHIDLRNWYDESKLLICTYAGQPVSHAPDYVYWYGEGPDGAKPERLLSRSYRHPVLKIAGVLDECPATRAQADQINQDWGNMLEGLRSTVPEVAVTERLRRPDWIQKRLDEAQARNDAAYERRQEAMAALSTFPLEGRYRLEATEAGVDAGDCIFLQKSNVGFFVIHCQIDGQEYRSADVLATLGELSISGREPFPGLTGSYYVDLDYQDAGNGHALKKGNHPSYPAHSQFIRTGDLVKISQFPMLGRYSLELTDGDKNLSAQCVVRPDTVGQSTPRFATECLTSDGTTIKSKAVGPNNDPATLWFMTWTPSPFELNGHHLADLHLRVADTYQADDLQSAVLTGEASYWSNGKKQRVTAVMERLGDLEEVAVTTIPSQQLAEQSKSTTASLPSGSAQRQLTVINGGRSVAGANRAIIMRVEGQITGGIHVRFKASGRAGFGRPDSSCLRNEDGSIKYQPSRIDLSYDRPGQYGGVIEFEAPEPGEWFLQYACEDAYSLALVARISE